MTEKQIAYMKNLANKYLLAKDENGDNLPEIDLRIFEDSKDGEKYFEELHEKMTDISAKSNYNETLLHFQLEILAFKSEMNFIMEHGYSNRWRFKEGKL